VRNVLVVGHIKAPGPFISRQRAANRLGCRRGIKTAGDLAIGSPANFAAMISNFTTETQSSQRFIKIGRLIFREKGAIRCFSIVFSLCSLCLCGKIVLLFGTFSGHLRLDLVAQPLDLLETAVHRLLVVADLFIALCLGHGLLPSFPPRAARTTSAARLPQRSSAPYCGHEKKSIE
jgi:hypothetical protein